LPGGHLSPVVGPAGKKLVRSTKAEENRPPGVTGDLPGGSMRGDRAENRGKMPTILMILGWRFFFYANERNEPIDYIVTEWNKLQEQKNG